MKKTLMQFAAMAMAFGAMKQSDRPLMTSDEKERMLNAARQYVCGVKQNTTMLKIFVRHKDLNTSPKEI